MTLLKNSTFYPTPPDLAKRMVEKIDLEDKTVYELNVLEPSAGSGDLIEALNKGRFDGFYGNGCFRDISAIEIDPELQATLRGKGIDVIDSDFMAYSGMDKFDLIIANPPFDDGDKHLLKAIDILYRGQIIFLLNAETIRRPHTKTRQLLKRKLKELDADVEFIKDAFLNAERKTQVEVALVNIIVERKVEEDLFKDVQDAAPVDEEVEEKFEVSNGKKVQELVAEYNEIVNFGTDTIIAYYRNYRKVGKYIGLNREADSYSGRAEDLTGIMQAALNKLLRDVRKDYWRRTFELPEVKKRMTEARRSEFEGALNRRSTMDFTENNIRQFVLNLIDGYEDALMKSVLALFDTFTKHGYQDGDIYEKNIHYFNGWKTNSSFKVGKKVIIPVYASYSERGPFVNDYTGEWELHHSVGRELLDIDVVMNYFDGMNEYYSIYDALAYHLRQGQSTNIESTYFTITVYKKGTMHLTFNDENILRRFNVAACKGKGWLQCNYGDKAYGRMSPEERNVVDSFEGKKSYDRNLRQPIFIQKSLLKIAA